jgi:protein-L-isoaspartate(D-aspartate) O-methyltransferase
MRNNDWDQLVQRLVREGILKSPRVIRAFREVPRALFVSEGSRSYASIDSPLPIGSGQTISAPLS